MPSAIDRAREDMTKLPATGPFPTSLAKDEAGPLNRSEFRMPTVNDLRKAQEAKDTQVPYRNRQQGAIGRMQEGERKIGERIHPRTDEEGNVTGFDMDPLPLIPAHMADMWTPYETFISDSAKKHGIPERVLKANIRTESLLTENGHLNPRSYREEPAINDASYGLGQILTGTAKMMGWAGTNADELYEPGLNIDLAAKYLRYVWDNKVGGGYEKTWDDERSLQALAAAYNAGSVFENAQGQFTNSQGVAEGVMKHVGRWMEHYGGMGLVSGKVAMEAAKYVDTIDETQEWASHRIGQIDAKSAEYEKKIGSVNYQKLREKAAEADAADMEALSTAQEKMAESWKENSQSPAAYLRVLNTMVEQETRPRVQEILRGEQETVARSAAAYDSIGKTLEFLIGVDRDSLREVYTQNTGIFDEVSPELGAVFAATTDWGNFHRTYVLGEQAGKDKKRNPRRAPVQSAGAMENVLERTDVGLALRRLFLDPQSFANARLALGMGDDRTLAMAQVAQVAPDILDFHNSRAIYEDVMGSRETIAEYGQRVLGIPFAESMASMDEWGNSVYGKLELARPGLSMNARPARKYEPVGEDTPGARFHRGIVEATSFGKEGWGAQVAPRSAPQELAFGFLPNDAGDAAELVGAMVGDLPFVIASYMLTPAAILSMGSARGIGGVLARGGAGLKAARAAVGGGAGATEALEAAAVASQRSGQAAAMRSGRNVSRAAVALAKGDPAMVAKGVFAHGTTAGLIYTAVSPRHEIGDLSGKVKDIPINVALFAGGDVFVYGVGAGVRAVRGGASRLLGPVGPKAKKVGRAFRDRIVSAQGEPGSPFGPSPKITGKAAAVPEAPGAPGQAGRGPSTLPQRGRPVGVGQDESLRVRRDRIMENVLQTWHRGMRDKALSRPQVEAVVNEGLLKGLDDDTIYSAFLDSYHEAGLPQVPGIVEYVPPTGSLREALVGARARGRHDPAAVPEPRSQAEVAQRAGDRTRLEAERAAIDKTAGAEQEFGRARREQVPLERGQTEGQAAVLPRAVSARGEARGAERTARRAARKARKDQRALQRGQAVEAARPPTAAEAPAPSPPTLRQQTRKARRAARAAEVPARGAPRRGRATAEEVAAAARKDLGTLEEVADINRRSVRALRSEHKKAQSRGYEGSIEEYAALPPETRARLAKKSEVGRTEIEEVSKEISTVARALDDILKSRKVDRKALRDALRAAASQQRSATLRRTIGTKGKATVRGEIPGGSYELDGKGLVLRMGGKTYSLDNRQLIKWIGENPPKVQQTRKKPPPSPKPGEVAPPAAASPEKAPAPKKRRKVGESVYGPIPKGQMHNKPGHKDWSHEDLRDFGTAEEKAAGRLRDEDTLMRKLADQDLAEMTTEAGYPPNKEAAARREIKRRGPKGRPKVPRVKKETPKPKPPEPEPAPTPPEASSAPPPEPAPPAVQPKLTKAEKDAARKVRHAKINEEMYEGLRAEYADEKAWTTAELKRELAKQDTSFRQRDPKIVDIMEKELASRKPTRKQKKSAAREELEKRRAEPEQVGKQLPPQNVREINLATRESILAKEAGDEDAILVEESLYDLLSEFQEAPNVVPIQAVEVVPANRLKKKGWEGALRQSYETEGGVTIPSNTLLINEEFARARPDRLAATIEHELAEGRGLSHDAAVTLERMLLSGEAKMSGQALELEQEILDLLKAGEPTPKLKPVELKKLPKSGQAAADQAKKIAAESVEPDDLMEIKSFAVDDLNTDASKFQNRTQGERAPDAKDFPLHQQEIAHILEDDFVDLDGLDLDDVINKVENWDWQKYDPITVFKYPDGRVTIVSGHHRHAAAHIRSARGEPGSASLPAKVFKGTEEEAMFFGQVEGNRGARKEGLLADISALSTAEAAGKSEPDLKALFKKELSTLRDLRGLDGGGPFMRALSAGSEGRPPHLEARARWVGRLRQDYDKMTNAHEREVFDWLYGGGKNHELEKGQFFTTVEKRLKDVFFDPNEPMALSSLTKDEILAQQPNMGSVLDEIHSRRQQITALREAAKGKDVSTDTMKVTEKEVDRLKEEITELYTKAQDIEQDQGMLFSRGESENPHFREVVDHLSEKTGLEPMDLSDEALDAAATANRKTQSNINAAFDSESRASIPNTHRTDSYKEAVRQAAGSKEFVDALLLHKVFSGKSTKPVTKEAWLKQVEQLMGDEWAWQELKEINSVASEAGLTPSQVSRIIRTMTPAGELPTYHDAMRAREVVQRVIRRRSKDPITDAELDELATTVADRELTLGQLETEGETLLTKGKRITKKGAYYEQTTRERARARGKNQEMLEELGIKTSDDAIAEDANNLREMWRNPEAGDEELVPQLAAEVLDVDREGSLRLGLKNALKRVFLPSDATRTWGRISPIQRTMQAQRPWALDVQERTGLKTMDVTKETQYATEKRSRLLHSWAVQFDRVHALEASEFVGGRLVPRNLRKVPKGMSRVEFNTRQDILKVDPDDPIRKFHMARLMETTHGREVERQTVISELRRSLERPKFKHLDADTIVKITDDYRRFYDDWYVLADGVSPFDYRKNYQPTVYLDSLRPGRFRVDDPLLGGQIEGLSHSLPRSKRDTVVAEELLSDPIQLLNIYATRVANLAAYSKVMPKAKMIDQLFTMVYGRDAGLTKTWRRSINGMLGKPSNIDVGIDQAINQAGDALRLIKYGNHSLADVFPMFRDADSFKAFYRATNKFVYSTLGKPSSIVKNSTQPIMLGGVGGQTMREETIKAFLETHFQKGSVFGQEDMARILKGKMPRQRTFAPKIDEAGNLQMHENQPLSQIEQMLKDGEIPQQYLPEMIEHRYALMKHGTVYRSIDDYAEYALTGYRLMDLMNRAIDFKAYTRTFDKMAKRLADGKIDTARFYDEIAMEFFHDVEVRRFVRMFEGGSAGDVRAARNFLAEAYVAHRQFQYGRGMSPGLMQGYIGGLFRFGSWGFHYVNFLRRMMTGQATRVRPGRAGKGIIERVRIRPFGVLPESATRLMPKIGRLNSGKAVDLTSHREDIQAGMQFMHFLGAGAMVAGVAAYGVGAYRPQDWVLFGPAPDPEMFSIENFVVPNTMIDVLHSLYVTPALGVLAATGIRSKDDFLDALERHYREAVRLSGPATAGTRAILAMKRYVEQTPLDVPGGGSQPITYLELMRGVLLNSDATTYRRRIGHRIRGRVRAQEKFDTTGATWFEDYLMDPAYDLMNRGESLLGGPINVPGLHREERKNARAAKKRARTIERRDTRTAGTRAFELLTQTRVGNR